MKIVTFLRQNGETKKWLLIFLGKETHSEKNHGNRQGFRRKKCYNNNGKHWKTSRIFRVKPNFFIFFLVHHFSHFFIFSFFRVLF